MGDLIKFNPIQYNERSGNLGEKNNGSGQSRTAPCQVTIPELFEQWAVPEARQSLSCIIEANREAYQQQLREARGKNKGQSKLYGELCKLIENPLLIEFIMFCQENPEVAEAFLRDEFERGLKAVHRKVAVIGD